MLKQVGYMMRKQRFLLWGKNILVSDFYYFPTKQHVLLRLGYEALKKSPIRRLVSKKSYKN